jgi:hypothetical protein
MVIGNAFATGVTVASAVAPCTEKPANEMVWPGATFDVPIVKVADRAPKATLAKVKVEVPEVVSEGSDPNVKPAGNVTVKLDPISSGEPAV